MSCKDICTPLNVFKRAQILMCEIGYFRSFWFRFTEGSKLTLQLGNSGFDQGSDTTAVQ